MESDREVIVCLDYFVEDYGGGAELTTEALLKKSPFKIKKIRSADITKDFIKENKDKFWIFGNFFNLDFRFIETLRTLNYAVICFDCIWCQYRNMQQHKADRKQDCNCHEYFGKKIFKFIMTAKKVFWMSEQQFLKQAEKFYEFQSEFTNEKNIILSSVFDDESLELMAELRKKKKLWRTKWGVFKSHNWQKGYANALIMCQAKRFKYIELGGMKYGELLDAMKDLKGLVYLPNGADSCPRMTIEMRLLGNEVILNDNVQHEKEAWFYKKKPEEIEEYLKYRHQIFWLSIKEVAK